MIRRASLFFSILGIVACGSSGGGESSSGGNTPTPTVGKTCAANAECTTGTEFCGDEKKCAAIPAGGEIGYRDGTSTSVTLTEIYKAPADKPGAFVDLAFNPSDETQLWVIGYADDSTHVGSGVTADSNGTWKRYVDPAAIHFMHNPTAISMGDAPFWGTCGDGDNRAATPDRIPNYFMGPALFTTDLKIFATRPTGLGSHYDMLHGSPFCKGIAHQEGSTYWVYNGYDKAIDKYVFNKPHEPGGDDHSDGEIYRFAAGQVTPVDKTPSHLVFDASDSVLYIADTGAGRIAKLDTKAGSRSSGLPPRGKCGAFTPTCEPLKAEGVMGGTDLVDVVPAGTLQKPSGIELKGDYLYVTDTETSTFHVFEKATGKAVRKLETGLPKGALAGFTFGPDKRIWFTDRDGSRVLRIDPK
jgi:hypothetical protein